uniref:Uncharacterized protein n=1 Tax=uncultured marine virus TaxID=186617 RepID=A0A0F7L4A6_9VIRU|nr:hypothetical protein [uncultured marine virus]
MFVFLFSKHQYHGRFHLTDLPKNHIDLFLLHLLEHYSQQYLQQFHKMLIAHQLVVQYLSSTQLYKHLDHYCRLAT